jgi:hypothetical protein
MAYPRVWKSPKKGDQANAQQPVGKSGRVTIQEHWKVLYAGADDMTTTAIEQDQLVVYAAVDADDGTELPRLGHVYDVGGKKRACTGVLPQRSTENPHLWDVQVTYEVQPLDFSGDDKIRNVTLSRGHRVVEETVYKDRINKWLWNVNGVLLPKLPTKKFVQEELSISYQCDAIGNLDDIDGALEHVNSDTVTFTINGITRTYDPRQMFLETAPFTATIIQKDGVSAYSYNVTLNFVCLRGDATFKFRAPNEGYEVWDDDLGDITNHVPEGQYLGTGGTPIKLDVDGKAITDRTEPPLMLPDGVGGTDFGADGRFEIEDQVTFSQLFTHLNDH